MHQRHRRFDEALALLEEAAGERFVREDPDQPTSLPCRYDLAVLNAMRGERAVALEMLQSATADSERVFGAGDAEREPLT